MNKKEVQYITKAFPVLFKRFNKETDRGSILVISALVEKMLRQTIEAKLLAPLESHDTLSKALDSFEFNIDLAYRLGLITSAEKKIYAHLWHLKADCIDKINAPEFDKAYFQQQLIDIIASSHLTWQVIQMVLLPSVLPNKHINSIEEFVSTLGWRKALQMFFALIILHKQSAIKKIDPLPPLNISIYDAT